MRLIDKVLQAVLGLFERRVEKETYEALNRGTARGMARFIAEQTGGEIDPESIIDVHGVTAIGTDDTTAIEAEPESLDLSGYTRKELEALIKEEELEINPKLAEYRLVDDLREAVAAELA